MTLRILVTGAGAPGTPGTVWALRRNPYQRPVEIVGMDINHVHGWHVLCDKFVWAFAPETVDYRSRMWDVVSRNQIDVVVPQCTRELVPLAEWAEFGDPPCAVMVSPLEAIQRAQSKRWIMDNASPAFRPEVATGSWVAKPDVESGKRGFVDLEGLVVMEKLPGTEYSVDCFGDTAVVRRRDHVRGGVSAVTEVVSYPELAAESVAIGKRAGLTTCYGVQFKCDLLGRPKLIDVNPRVMGTMVASALAGVPLLWASVCRAAGIHAPRLPEPVIGTQYVRTRGGVGVVGNERIVI